MGIITLSRFQDKLKASLGRSPSTTDMTDWVNNAMYEFGYALKFPELQGTGFVDTVQGTTDYALPADFRAFSDDGIAITSPQNRAYGIMTSETRSQYLRSVRFAATTNQGSPTYYHKFMKRLWLRPTPDATVTRFTYDYWKRITPLSGVNDVSPFDEDWDDIIYRGALYRGHLSYGEHDRMINVFNLFLGVVRSRVMAEDLEEFPEGGISMIQSPSDANVR